LQERDGAVPLFIETGQRGMIKIKRRMALRGGGPIGPGAGEIDGLRKLKAQRLPQHHSVTISAKSKTPIADIRKVII
jgi:hypothetical protein